jgi:elongation factor Ts
MAVTAELVKTLREKTGAGMMDCKRALEESGGDFEKAIEYLRKKGAAIAAKRAERSAKEGVVVTKLSDDKKTGVILELMCETDFVARSDDFLALSKNLVDLIFDNNFDTREEVLSAKIGDLKVSEMINDVLSKIGEKIELSRFKKVTMPSGVLVDYIHPGAKLGVLIAYGASKETPVEFAQLGKDLAMQVAAMRPLVVRREEVDKTLLEKEIEIYKSQARNEGKPEQILDKIAAGKLEKFYQEVCLLEQAFVKDGSKVVGELINNFNKTYNADVKVLQFFRFHLADEKK